MDCGIKAILQLLPLVSVPMPIVLHLHSVTRSLSRRQLVLTPIHTVLRVLVVVLVLLRGLVLLPRPLVHPCQRLIVLRCGCTTANVSDFPPRCAVCVVSKLHQTVKR